MVAGGENRMAVDMATPLASVARASDRAGYAHTTFRPQPVRSATQREAASADDVRDAMTRARLRPDRTNRAVSAGTDPFRGGIDR